MPRLPLPGSDEGTWGEILNDYLTVAHATDGTLKPGSVTPSALAANSVTPTKLAANTPTSGQVLSYNGTSFEWITPTSGVTDHGLLSGLSDDDHPQYHTDTRGDARYYTQAQVDTALDAKAGTSHAHTAIQITDATTTGRSVMTATDAAAARTAIGAGTSSFDGAYDSLTGKPSLGTAAAAETTDFASAAWVLHGVNFTPRYPGRYHTTTAFHGSMDDFGTLPSGRLEVLPFVVAVRDTFDQQAVSVRAVGEVGSLIRLGVYAENPVTHLPGALMLDAGTVTADSTGDKSLTIAGDLVLDPGLYYLVLVSNDASGTVRVRKSAGNNDETRGFGLYGADGGLNVNAGQILRYTGYTTAVTAGLPNPADLSGTVSSDDNNFSLTWLRRKPIS